MGQHEEEDAAGLGAGGGALSSAVCDVVAAGAQLLDREFSFAIGLEVVAQLQRLRELVHEHGVEADLAVDTDEPLRGAGQSTSPVGTSVVTISRTWRQVSGGLGTVLLAVAAIVRAVLGDHHHTDAPPTSSVTLRPETRA